MKNFLTATQWNLLANLLGQGFSAGFSFLFVPFYLSLLGTEGYGLVGFASTLQALMVVFDFGISSIANRQMAILYPRADAANELRTLIRGLLKIYCGIGIGLGLAIVLLAPWIAEYWLKSRDFEVDLVVQVVRLIGLWVAFQWPWTYFQACLNGMQKHGTMNLLLVINAILRYPGIVLILWLNTPSPPLFFFWQIGIAFLHSLLGAIVVYFLLPPPISEPTANSPPISWRSHFHFGAGMGMVVFLAILFQHADKLILSKLVSLDQYGAYYLASGVAATALLILALPVSTSIYSRLTQLFFEKKTEELMNVYHDGCQFVSVLVFPAGLPMVFSPRAVLLLWGIPAETLEVTAPLLRLVACGTVLFSLTLIPFTMEIAKGALQLIIKIYWIMVALYILAIFMGVYWVGIEGAGFAWIIINVVFVFFAIPITQQFLFPGTTQRWIFQDIILVLFPGILVNIVFCQWEPQNRWESAWYLGLVLSSGYFFTFAAASTTRNLAKKFIARLFKNRNE